MFRRLCLSVLFCWWCFVVFVCGVSLICCGCYIMGVFFVIIDGVVNSMFVVFLFGIMFFLFCWCRMWFFFSYVVIMFGLIVELYESSRYYGGVFCLNVLVMCCMCDYILLVLVVMLMLIVNCWVFRLLVLV